MPMEIVSGDRVFPVPPPASVNYRADNPLARLMSLLERVELSSERENYLLNSIQYLVPYDFLELYGPSDAQWNEANPRFQNNKEDFQKQNIKDFRATDAWLARGWATAGSWTGPFLFLSYRGGPDSKLSEASGGQLGPSIQVYLKVGNATGAGLLTVPYNPRTDRYELEIWGYDGNDLRSQLDRKGQEAIDRGGLIVRRDLVQGAFGDFAREGLDNRDMRTVSPNHALHPILPLKIEMAWANSTATAWDSQSGRNYHYQFGMIFRGWDNFLKVGVSQSPHGGFGFLHYRNVLSNYFDFRESGELGREVEPWMFGADGAKTSSPRKERFLAVEYMDLHILKPECGIGIHRHRDNQEIFFMMVGTGIMVVGDWCQFPDRERAFEIRAMGPGSFSLLKAGQLHALFNVTDEDMSLLMFGGYD
jgi:mannose-6-phosphate isomerase-like protein (cupin superfamily)